MQIQVQGLLQFSPAVFPTAKVRESLHTEIPPHNLTHFTQSVHFPSFQKDLIGIQRLLNSSEFNLHQLTALLDCRSLHKVSSCSVAQSDASRLVRQTLFRSFRIIWRLSWVFVMTAWRGSCICACSLCWEPVPSAPCCVPCLVPGLSSPSGTSALSLK